MAQFPQERETKPQQKTCFHYRTRPFDVIHPHGKRPGFPSPNGNWATDITSNPMNNILSPKSQSFTATSSLLDNHAVPMPIGLAQQLGRMPALFLQQVHYWLGKSKHVVDGRKWIYNTMEQWSEQLGLSLATVKRIISLLKALKILIVERRQSPTWNQTNWYSIDYERLKPLISPSGSKRASRSAQNEPLDQLKMSLSSTETTSQEKTTTNTPPTQPVVVRIDREESRIFDNENFEGIVPTDLGEDSKLKAQGLMQPIDFGEALSSAAAETILNDVQQEISPEPLHGALKRMILDYSIEQVKTALEALREAKRENRVSNPTRYLVAALRDGYEPQQSDSAPKPSGGWGEWFTHAQKLGLALCGQVRAGVQGVITREGNWMPYQELEAEYPLGRLQEMARRGLQ